jgi:heme A synthase
LGQSGPDAEQTRAAVHPLQPWTRRLALVVAAATLAMLVAGGATTTMKSGDSEPAWSVRFWEWFQPWSGLSKDVGGPFYELSHRQVGTVLGFLLLWLLGFLWRAEPRAWVRRAGWIAFGALVLQGVLGGVRVLMVNDPPWREWAEGCFGSADNARIVSSMAHAALGYALFACLCAIAWAAGGREPVRPRVDERAAASGLGALSLWLCAAVFAQLILGAWVRHAGLVIPIVLVHAGGMLPVVLLSLALAVRAYVLRGATGAATAGQASTPPTPPYTKGGRTTAEPSWTGLVTASALRLAVLVQVQVALGAATYVIFAFSQRLGAGWWYAVDPWVRTAHQVLGAVILAYAVVTALRIRQRSAAVAAPEPVAETVGTCA